MPTADPDCCHEENRSSSAEKPLLIDGLCLGDQINHFPSLIFGGLDQIRSGGLPKRNAKQLVRTSDPDKHIGRRCQRDAREDLLVGRM